MFIWSHRTFHTTRAPPPISSASTAVGPFNRSTLGRVRARGHSTAEYLFKQLPKFTFLHAPKCTQQAQPKNARRNKPPGVGRPTGIRLRRNRDNRRPCAASAPWRRLTIAQSSSAARSWPLFGHAPLREVAQRHSGLFAHLTQRFVVMGAQIAQYMADGLAKRYLSGFVGGFRGCRHGSCGNAFRVFLPPYAGQCGLALVFGLFGRAGTQHLLLGEHHRAALGWGEFLTRALPLCTVGTIALSSICSLVSVIVSMPPAPLSLSYVRPLWSTPYSWIIPVKVLKESSVFPEYIARFRAARLPRSPFSDAAHKQLFDAHECH